MDPKQHVSDAIDWLRSVPAGMERALGFTLCMHNGGISSVTKVSGGHVTYTDGSLEYVQNHPTYGEGLRGESKELSNHDCYPEEPFGVGGPFYPDTAKRLRIFIRKSDGDLFFKRDGTPAHHCKPTFVEDLLQGFDDHTPWLLAFPRNFYSLNIQRFEWRIPT